MNLSNKHTSKTKLLTAILILFTGTSFAGISNEQGGTFLGAIGGGVLGNQVGSGKGKTAATIVGTIAGGFVGNQVGKSVDEKDRQRELEERRHAAYMEEMQEQEMDPDYYPVKKHKSYHSKKYAKHKHPCRAYKSTAWIDGEPYETTGRACLVKGKWQIVN